MYKEFQGNPVKINNNKTNGFGRTLAAVSRKHRSSTNEWIKKLWYIYMMEYYAAKELLPFATAWMELESIMLSEISQVVKDKYYMISPLSET